MEDAPPVPILWTRIAMCSASSASQCSWAHQLSRERITRWGHHLREFSRVRGAASGLLILLSFISLKSSGSRTQARSWMSLVKRARSKDLEEKSSSSFFHPDLSSYELPALWGRIVRSGILYFARLTTASVTLITWIYQIDNLGFLDF